MDTLLHYREQGNGQTVVLIHGFPLNLQVWDDFAEKLSEFFHVVVLDLPGFGKSPGLGKHFTLEDVAQVIHNWMQDKRYLSPVVIGHSLGGYVTLALVELEPDALAGMCLFHSTALADSQEKKQSRDKVLEFIGKQGVHAYTSNFIAQLYADQQHSSITKIKSIATQASEETVVGFTQAMRDRKDRTHVLDTFRRPVLLLGGEKDAGIPPDTLQQQASLNPLAEAFILPDVAHMGMFEAEGPALRKIKSFIDKCVVTF